MARFLFSVLCRSAAIFVLLQFKSGGGMDFVLISLVGYVHAMMQAEKLFSNFLTEVYSMTA